MQYGRVEVAWEKRHRRAETEGAEGRSGRLCRGRPLSGAAHARYIVHYSA
jgi:hypothetical protein